MKRDVEFRWKPAVGNSLDSMVAGFLVPIFTGPVHKKAMHPADEFGRKPAVGSFS